MWLSEQSFCPWDLFRNRRGPIAPIESAHSSRYPAGLEESTAERCDNWFGTSRDPAKNSYVAKNHAILNAANWPDYAMVETLGHSLGSSCNKWNIQTCFMKHLLWNLRIGNELSHSLKNKNKSCHFSALNACRLVCGQQAFLYSGMNIAG